MSVESIPEVVGATEIYVPRAESSDFQLALNGRKAEFVYDEQRQVLTVAGPAATADAGALHIVVGSDATVGELDSATAASADQSRNLLPLRIAIAFGAATALAIAAWLAHAVASRRARRRAALPAISLPDSGTESDPRSPLPIGAQLSQRATDKAAEIAEIGANDAPHHHDTLELPAWSEPAVHQELPNQLHFHMAEAPTQPTDIISDDAPPPVEPNPSSDSDRDPPEGPPPPGVASSDSDLRLWDDDAGEAGTGPQRDTPMATDNTAKAHGTTQPPRDRFIHRFLGARRSRTRQRATAALCACSLVFSLRGPGRRARSRQLQLLRLRARRRPQPAWAPHSPPAITTAHAATPAFAGR